MSYSAQTDRFVHDRLPPPAQGPRLDYNLPELQLPAQVNLVQALFAGAALRGLADRPLLRSPRRTLSYAQAQLEVARIAQMLGITDLVARNRLGGEPGGFIVGRVMSGYARGANPTYGIDVGGIGRSG